MKLQQKIILISFITAVIGSVLLAVTNSVNKATDYIFYFGIVAFWGGIIQLIVGLFMLMLKDKRVSQGLLMSAGILILVGFIVCTGTFSTTFNGR